MPKFGQVHFGRNYFGDSPYPTENWKRSYLNIPLGLRVRKQLGKTIIFRVRRGNGVAGAVAGRVYQDKYKYVVPGNIDNIEGEPARVQLAAAVSNWKTVLTVEQKTEYNKRATKGLRMSGYNLYIREYIKANI